MYVLQSKGLPDTTGSEMTPPAPTANNLVDNNLLCQIDITAAQFTNPFLDL